MALELPELSPRELAVRFTDEQRYFASEASVYRLLKAHDLITSPAYIVIKGETMSAIGPRTMVERRGHRQDHGTQPALADRLHLSQGDRLGWHYLSTVLDDFSRFVVAWKLCTTDLPRAFSSTAD